MEQEEEETVIIYFTSYCRKVTNGLLTSVPLAYAIKLVKHLMSN